MKALEESFQPKTITPSPLPPSEGLRARVEAREVTTVWALLCWAYGRQKVHMSGDAVGAMGYGGISATGAVVERLRLGVSVDCSRRGYGGSTGAWSASDDDALEVHRYVSRLGRHARTVIDAASVGTAPEWRPFIPPLKVGPILRGNGKPKMEYANNRPVLCLLRYDGFLPGRAWDVVAHSRQVYAEWWAALSVLCDVLTEVQPLRRWYVSGIGAEAQPWCG